MAIHYRQDRELVGYLFVSSQDSAEVQEAAEEIAEFTGGAVSELKWQIMKNLGRDLKNFVLAKKA